MKRAFLVTALGVTFAILRSGPSLACSLQDLEISDAKTEKLLVYNDDGKFVQTVDPRKVLPAKIVGCKDSQGLVQLLAQADGSKVWIDPIQVRLPTAKPSQTTHACLTTRTPAEHGKQILVANAALLSSRLCVKP